MVSLEGVELGKMGRRRAPSPTAGRVVELFAGVGGFRLGLEPAGWEVVWANQWEPSTKAQHAFDCYVSHFETGVHVNEDINVVLDEIESGKREDIPDHDLLVGGFPCQDYSVAKALGASRGIEGDKGALWWSIWRILERKRPRLVFLENVDRMLRSPSAAPGRDFAIMLGSLAKLRYGVEWRVANAADYGFPQRRRRAFLVAFQLPSLPDVASGRAYDWLLRSGPLARSLSVTLRSPMLAGWEGPDIRLRAGNQVGRHFAPRSSGPFRNTGLMLEGAVWTVDVSAVYKGPCLALGDVLERESSVPNRFFIPRREIPHWRYLKGKKQEERIARNGYSYTYSEGAIPFPDPVDQPSRTILTNEGGSAASRFRHVIRTESGRYRKLMPVELERLNGFPDGWTDTGMSDGRRAFMMGNALVVGLVRRVAHALGAVCRADSDATHGGRVAVNA